MSLYSTAFPEQLQYWKVSNQQVAADKILLWFPHTPMSPSLVALDAHYENNLKLLWLHLLLDMMIEVLRFCPRYHQRLLMCSWLITIPAGRWELKSRKKNKWTFLKKWSIFETYNLFFFLLLQQLLPIQFHWLNVFLHSLRMDYYFEEM